VRSCVSRFVHDFLHPLSNRFLHRSLNARVYLLRIQILTAGLRTTSLTACLTIGFRQVSSAAADSQLSSDPCRSPQDCPTALWPTNPRRRCPRPCSRPRPADDDTELASFVQLDLAAPFARQRSMMLVRWSAMNESRIMGDLSETEAAEVVIRTGSRRRAKTAESTTTLLQLRF
jgi:hypothetical protein